MAPAPGEFLSHLRTEGYHPRSDKHSNLLASLIVRDLLSFCEPMAEKAQGGKLVYQLNQTLYTGTAEWNVDLVLGEPPPGAEFDLEKCDIARAAPSSVQIALEIKSVMTEHRKAVKNRKRDFEAHHDHVHRYNNRTIAAGLLLLNGSKSFKSPLRNEPTEHKNPEKLLEHCIRELRAVSHRVDLSGTGLEAKGVLVVDFDNQDLASASYVTRGSAPAVGDPLHYDAFLQRICGLYPERFG